MLCIRWIQTRRVTPGGVFWADSVRLYPTPGTIYTVYVRGYQDPSAFGAGAADAAEPADLPAPFHILIATYGIARAYEQQGRSCYGWTVFRLV